MEETGSGEDHDVSLIACFADALAGPRSDRRYRCSGLNLQDLRRNIGLVFQESFLFSNTVAANIARTVGSGTVARRCCGTNGGGPHDRLRICRKATTA